MGKPYDRKWTNSDDGRTFYGQDDGEGKTIWYDENGEPDSISGHSERL